jgi:hypothetical protein
MLLRSEQINSVATTKQQQHSRHATSFINDNYVNNKVIVEYLSTVWVEQIKSNVSLHDDYGKISTRGHNRIWRAMRVYM